MMRIYLDHNAAAPLRPNAREEIVRVLAECGNPSSVHRSGQRARRELERARERVANLIGAPARSIVFTSGGTESNNLAIFGVAESAKTGRNRIVTSMIEHSSVLEPVAMLERRGFEVIRVKPDSCGCVEPASVISAINERTALVTLGLANSEVGTIQDVSPIAHVASSAGAVFHLDAAQAVGRIPVSVGEYECDLMTLSAHKIGGPSGIGALYVRPGLAISPQIAGGPHESGLRAGTPNLPGAIGFGSAAEEVAGCLESETSRMRLLADILMRRLMNAIPSLELNGPDEGRIPNTLNLTFPGVLGESMLIALDLEGVEVSMGSACAAGAVEPSHVLTAMGRSAAEARSSLRISLGWTTTAEEIALASEIISTVWRRVAETEPAVAAESSR